MDDNPDILEALTGLIETWQCVPFPAATANAARELIDSGQPIDYAIVDDMLGQDETGLELANYIADKIPSQPIIITGNVLPSRLQEITSYGYDIYQKPVNIQQLRKAIATRTISSLPEELPAAGNL